MPSENTVECLNIKIKAVLNNLSSPKFRISDHTILLKLYDCLSLLLSQDSNSSLLELFLPWIEMMVKDRKGINPSAFSFALKILSLISSKEYYFCLLTEKSILIETCECVKESKFKNTSILSDYLDFIKAAISHQSGCQWICQNEIWKEILFLARNNPSIYALRQASNILPELIRSLENNNLSISSNIMDEIFLPVCTSVEERSSLLKAIAIVKNIPYHHDSPNGPLKSLNSVVIARETILKLLFINQPNHIGVNLILKNYDIQKFLYTNIDNATDVREIVELSKLLCVVNFGLLEHSDKNVLTFSDMCILRDHFLNHCDLLLKKQQLSLILKFCIEYLKLWKHFGMDVVYETKDTERANKYSIENTLFIILTIPVFTFIGMEDFTDSDLKYEFVQNMFGNACSRTMKFAFSFKEEIFAMKSVESTASSTVQCFIRISNICKKEHALMIFEILNIILQKLFPSTDFPDKDIKGNFYEGPQYDALAPEYYELLSSTIEALHCYIKTFNLSWNDSLDTICLMPSLQKIIAIRDITPQLSVSVLKLQKVVLRGYLPYLAHLIEAIQDSSINYIGHQILKNLLSIHWEIRDSSLELLQVICILSENNLTTFQKVILDNNLTSAVVNAFENDSQPYVKGSALSCLCPMVRIQVFWNDGVSYQRLLEKVLHSLLHEPEGLVRHQAILLLKEIYKFGELSPEEIEKVIDVLYHVTITDLHWEVKNGAVLFWDSILEKYLANEGMVDGDFPNHFSSTEKTKVIKSTPTEPSVKIRKVFEVLSDYGGLHALWLILQDDCDMEVTKEAGKLICKMLNLIQKFNVPVNKLELCGETEIHKCGIKRKLSSEEMETDRKNVIGENDLQHSTDEVIESIISEGDIKLVCGLLKNLDAKEFSPKLRPRNKLSVDSFYWNASGFDINEKQLEKARWLHKTSDGISSLLDDILAENQFVENKNVSVDCY